MHFFGRHLFLSMRLTLLAAGLLLAWLPSVSAQAHANLVRSYPETGAVLAEPPRVLTLEFSEALDPNYIRIELLDVHSQVVADGPPELDAGDPRRLQMPLPVLADGTYSESWRVRSAVDGHVTNGLVSFSVGLESPRATLLPLLGAPDPATALPRLTGSFFRWAGFLAAALAAGSPLFGLLVWRPAFRGWEARNESADLSTSRLMNRLTLIGIGILALATVGGFVEQAVQISEGRFWETLAGSLTHPGHTGAVTWARLWILGLMALLARRRPQYGSGPARSGWEVAALGVGALLTFSLQSHSAALGSALVVAADWLHLAAMAAWMGGLLALAWLLRQGEGSRSFPPAKSLVPRFSRVALASVAVLSLTGLYSALVHVDSLEALKSTTYGRVLSVKTALFALLTGLGAANLLLLSPRLRDAAAKALGKLRRNVRLELFLGAAVLLAAGLLTATPPAQEALRAQQRLGLLETARAGGVQMKLRVAPARVGENEFGIDLSGRGIPPPANSGEVLLRFEALDHDMGITQVETQTQDGRRYTARGSYLSMAGNWEVEVIFRREGFDDLRLTFDLQVMNEPLENEVPNPIPPDEASISAGELLYQENCLPCHGAQGKGDGPVGLTLNPRPADLTQHSISGVHSDGQLFEWISEGYPGSVMPAFKDVLAEEQRWHLVNYMRTLAPEATQAP